VVVVAVTGAGSWLGARAAEAGRFRPAHRAEAGTPPAPGVAAADATTR
jgi:hypothetical protein